MVHHDMATFLVLLLMLTCYCQALIPACSVCSCLTNNGIVRCQNLKEFPNPRSFPVNTTSLYVSYSDLTAGIPTDELDYLTELKTLVFVYNDMKNVSKFGSLNIISLQLDHNGIEEIDSGSFDNLQELSKLSLTYNKLRSFPSFKKASKLTELFLQGNDGIGQLSRESLQNLPLLEKLDLEDTGIEHLGDGIFKGNQKLFEINLAQTESLSSIHENAFEGVTSLQTLKLDNTRIISLPMYGLENLRFLSLKDVPNFWQLPDRLWSMRKVYMSQYNGFLCCGFKFNVYNKDCATQIRHRGQTTTPSSHKQTSSSAATTASTTTRSGGGWPWPTGGGGWPTLPSQKTTTSSNGTTTVFNGTLPTQLPSKSTTGFPWPWGREKQSNGNNRFFTWPGQSNGTQPTTSSSQGGGGGFGTLPTGFSTHKVNTPWFTFPPADNTTAAPPTVVTHSNNTNNASFFQCPDVTIEVKCYPQPDAFHPCEDIMGHTLLTAVSLIVGLSAVFSNLVVSIVLLTSQRRLNVTRFLMCNLSFADFCLGLYILILASYSIETHGEYYNHVRSWQLGAGCKILGFLAVFSSELSLFTLVVMTVERFYAIVYAMQLNTRLSFRWSLKMMAVGWMFAFLMAALPLLGASSYHNVAICLPFDVSDAGSTVYVSLLLFLNGFSFVFVVYLYARMLHVVVKGGDMEGAPKRNDKKVAKRMALLVFTDMACWAPIAFFGLLAAFGAPLINVTGSKILLVFFFPINSVCNPFLYAFFTKAFKREFYALLSRFGFCKFRALKYNGTLSSVLYSRSRRNQHSRDDRRKRISTVSNPSLNDFGKRISTVSSPSIGDFKRSNLDLVKNDSKPAENVEMVQLNGITNISFVEDKSQKAKPTSCETDCPNTEDEDVFICQPPTSKPGSAPSSSPRSILKKSSIVKNLSIDETPSERIDTDCNSIDNMDHDINGILNHGCDGNDLRANTESKASVTGTTNSPKSKAKKISIIINNDEDENKTAKQINCDNQDDSNINETKRPIERLPEHSV